MTHVPGDLRRTHWRVLPCSAPAGWVAVAVPWGGRLELAHACVGGGSSAQQVARRGWPHKGGQSSNVANCGLCGRDAAAAVVCLAWEGGDVMDTGGATGGKSSLRQGATLLPGTGCDTGGRGQRALKTAGVGLLGFMWPLPSIAEMVPCPQIRRLT